MSVLETEDARAQSGHATSSVIPWAPGGNIAHVDAWPIRCDRKDSVGRALFTCGFGLTSHCIVLSCWSARARVYRQHLHGAYGHAPMCSVYSTCLH